MLHLPEDFGDAVEIDLGREGGGSRQVTPAAGVGASPPVLHARSSHVVVCARCRDYADPLARLTPDQRFVVVARE